MTPDRLLEARGRSDRRRRPTSARDAFGLRGPGRRKCPRRVEERRTSYFVDLIDVPTFLLAVSLLVLTVVDGTFTLVLLGSESEEINPAMSYLLSLGPTQFLLGKYLLTSAGLSFLLVFRHVPLFQTRVRVGHLLPVFVGLYLLLLGYQIALLSIPDPPAGKKDRLALMRTIPNLDPGMVVRVTSSPRLLRNGWPFGGLSGRLL